MRRHDSTIELIIIGLSCSIWNLFFNGLFIKHLKGTRRIMKGNS